MTASHGAGDGGTGAGATALGGVKVLDFSRVLAGPLAAMTLGDLGADVIKVERPGSGDDTRAWGPPFKGDDAAYFLSLNRNKKSVVLDLATDEGRSIAVRLAGGCDVVLENFRPGLMDSWGLGFDALNEAYPRLVYCSVTAFGSEPASSQPGYDIIMQGVTGLMSITGQDPGAPTKSGVAILDVIAGLQATVGVLAALAARERTGRGQRVEVSLFEAGVAALVNQAANHLIGGAVPGPMGNAHPNIVPYQTFEAADRPFILAVGNDRLFGWACEAIGRPELAADPRWATNRDRVRNRAELTALLGEVFGTRDADTWLSKLSARKVPCAPIRALDEVFGSPEGQTAVETVADPVRGDLRLVANPVRMSDTPASTRRPPPALGEHTEEVLAGLADSMLKGSDHSGEPT
ncbi:MAG: CoA transferase [Actinomycetota bacterium]|nr:CoA transferase [Actinomycetota bacterium]